MSKEEAQNQFEHAGSNIWEVPRNLSYRNLRNQQAEGLARITINRPETRNASCPETVRELIDAFVERWRDTLALSPAAPRAMNAGLKADTDGLAVNAAGLFYATDAAQQGKNTFLEKRPANVARLPRRA